jgi:gliding motility-associated-like protein
MINGSSFYAGKRVPVEVYVSQLCGQPFETACDGSILFEEDFRGNDTSDALFGNTPLYPPSQHDIPYGNYSLVQSTTLNVGQYALPKEIFGVTDDHTFEQNNQRGRMLHIYTKTSAPDTIIGINIGNICKGLTYTFSVWILNIDASNNPNLVFELANPVTGTVCSRFTTGDIHQNISNQWLQYGFQYKASADYQNLKLYIMNLTGETKILMDDIKIAICIDPVSINLSHDTICIDESTQFTAVLNEASIRDSLGVSRLGYLWQYNNGQDSIWANVYYSNSIKTYSISNGKFSHKGYYRVIVGDYTTLSLANGIRNPNCAVYSDQVYLHVKECFTAYDDYVITSKDSLLTADILDNDIIPCSNPVVTVNTNPHHGTASIDGNNDLNYQPDNGFTGIDSLQYKVICGNETKYAWVYIVTAGIKANQYSGCPGAEIILEVDSISNVIVKWYRQAAGGTGISTGTSYALIIPNTDTMLYVEFIYQGVTLSERIPVYIVLSELCGDYTNKACEGNIVFMENFKGNNPNDPSIGTALSLPVYSDYTFSASSYFGAGEYSVCKNKANDPANSWDAITDHTYSNDTSSGYFMYVHTQNNLSMIYRNEISVSLCNREEDIYLSAWLRNFNTQQGVSKPILRFVVEDSTGQILLDYLTGEISFDNQWKQYGATFKLGVNTTRMIIKLYNLNSSHSFIALDDIEFRICTPSAINITSNSHTLCQDDNLILSPTYNQNALNAVYGAGNVIFRWQKSSTGDMNDNSSWTTLSGRTSDTLSFSSIQLSDEGYYRMIAGNASTINNPACRTASDAMRVLVNPLPIASHSGITAMCIGDTTQLSVTGGSTYSWLHNTSQDSVIKYKITTNDTLTVQVISSKGCSINHKIRITAYELPVVNLTPDTSLCITSSIRLEAKTTGTGLQYLWNTQAMTKTLDISPAYPQTYWVRVTNSNGCKKTDSVYVDVLPLPIVYIVGDTVICWGETFSLTAHGGVSYLWSDGTTTASLQKQPLQNIAYKVTATDGNGCTNSKSVQIIVNNLPNVSISGTTSLCAGDTSTITASGGISYQWSNGDVFSSTFINPTKNDTLKVTVTNVENCSITKEIPVTVFPLPEIVILGDTGVCQGKSFSISASAPGFILTSYKWNTGATTSGLTYLPDYSDYYVVTVEDSRGCTGQQQHFVTVYELPEVWITGISSICPGEEIQLQANGNALQYIWNTGEKGTVLTDYPQNNKTYTLKGINVYGCESPLQVFDVTIHPFPKATIKATPLRISKKNSTVSFKANLTNGEQALWDVGDGSQYVQGEFSHTYTVVDGVDTFYAALVVTTQYGCKDTAYQIILIEQHIPNTFTPNGDGFNDLFLEDCKCSNIQIFDRLGVKLYDGQGPWDGKYKGSVVANDTYFYIITYSSGDIQKGYISVIGSKK